MNESRTFPRIELIEAYRNLTGVLARLAHDGSNYARMAWDRLPATAPIASQGQLAVALHVAREDGPLAALAFSEAAPEWLAYRNALWAFSQRPTYGPPPMHVPAGVVAATCDAGRVLLTFAPDRPVGK